MIEFTERTLLNPLEEIVSNIITLHTAVPPAYKELYDDPCLFYNRNFTPYIKEDGTTSGFDSI